MLNRDEDYQKAKDSLLEALERPTRNSVYLSLLWLDSATDRLSAAQAGGEPTSKWSEYMRSDAGQLEVEKQYAAALREEVDRLKESLTDARERTATVLNDLDDERRHMRAKDAEITRLRDALTAACERMEAISSVNSLRGKGSGLRFEILIQGLPNVVEECRAALAPQGKEDR